MSDYGIKVSKPGYDVNTVSEENLSYSSDFRGLKIYQMGSGTVSILNGNTESNVWSLAHGINYRPAYMFFVKQTISATTSYILSPLVSESYGTLPGAIAGIGDTFSVLYDGDSACSVDDTNIYFKFKLKAASSGTTTIYFTYIIFSDPIESTTAVGPTSSDSYGIKVSTEGNDVSTAEEYNLSVLSSRKQFNVIQSGTGTITLPEISSTVNVDYCIWDTQSVTEVISHNLGYIPAFLIYIQNLSFCENAESYMSISPAWYQQVSARGDVVGMFYGNAYADTTNITVRLSRGAGCVLTSAPPAGNTLSEVTLDYRYMIFNTDLEDVS